MLIQAGQKTTASLLTALEVQAIIKPTDQQVSSATTGTTFQNDTDLVLPVLANVKYLFDFYIDYEGGATGSSDLKLQWSVPVGATLRYGADYASPVGPLNPITGFTLRAADTIAAGTNGSALMAVRGKGSLVVSTTAGSIQLQWAQVTSSATPTIVHAQSYLALWEVT